MRVHENIDHPGKFGRSTQAPQTSGNTPPPPSANPVDTTSLSAEARAALGGDEISKGKSAQSPAHRARLWLESEGPASAGDVNFGKLVSRIAQGGSEADLINLIANHEASPSDTGADPASTSPASDDPAANTAPADDPVVDASADPVVEPPADPADDPLVDASADPVADPPVGPVEDPLIDASTDPAPNPLAEPVVDPTIDPAVGEDIVDLLTPDEDPDANAA